MPHRHRCPPGWDGAGGESVQGDAVDGLLSQGSAGIRHRISDGTLDLNGS